MSKDLIDKMHRAFDSHEQKKEIARNAEEQKKTEHELFLEQFKKIRSEIIKPTMVEIGNIIVQRGHKYSVNQKEESNDLEGRITPANIQIEIYPDGEQPDRVNRNFPHLSFIAGTYDNKTYTHVSTMMPNRGGMSGKRNDYALEEITVEKVKEEIVQLITECFEK